MLDILVGGFYGDEGKGKVATYLALKDKPEIAVRTGSINAGHTAVYKGRTYRLRSIPSAFINKRTRLAIPPGALIKLDVFLKEMEETHTKDRIMIDGHVGVITDAEVEEEVKNSILSKEIGSTKQGVGAAESKRIMRSLKLAKDYSELSDFIVDVPKEIVKCSKDGLRIQVEGSQGHMLSLYHGEYPYVTSRNTMASGILNEVGVGPKYVDNIVVIFKAFTTRVGAGSLRGELSPKEAQNLGFLEFGTVTGRQRRAAPFDPELANAVIKINSANQVAITKLDVLFKNAAKVNDFNKLPKEAKDWINSMEDKIGAPVTLIGTGEDALDMIDRRKEVSGK
ncbi:MAG: adenylosuccinate synthetase [Candidatus Micrarchaeota archaeon]|nr:adenylosuccinate synthetase [Candidatus Micrarchaeota archaeon]MDE1833719.1 adenylosuccinate synthetase [Candidatus Micrarchaeota archaeon]MDE1859843.1 adenylosuccinate synthetase [Candidatus Micrarchaeota archaeon]